MKKILVVDDEKNIRRIVMNFLENEGYNTIEASSGESAIDIVMDGETIDLILLDIRMPVMDGYETLEYIRKFTDTPVIFLTALKETYDEVKGLELGADDYIVKPFSNRVLLARVKVCIRKNEKNIVDTLVVDNFVVDFSRKVVLIDNRNINLTQKEFEILNMLIKSNGSIVDRLVILDKVWGYEYTGYSSTLNTHMKTLRNKMGRYSNHIKTIRGVGYRFEKNEV